MNARRLDGPTPTQNTVESQGLTLVELLAVLTALGLLLIVTLPAIASTARGSEKHFCANNLRQIARATQLYASENHERLPHPTWGSVGGSPGPDGWCYTTRLDGVQIPSAENQLNNAAQLPYFRAGQLGPLLGSPEPMMCPTDARLIADQTDGGLYKARALKLTSYEMNGAPSSYASFSVGPWGVTSGSTHKVTRFQPGDILFWEADETNPFNFNDAGSQPREGISLRHGMGGRYSATALVGDAPVARADGSVRYLDFQEFWDLAGGGISQGFRPVRLPNELWCDPASATGGY